jgi:hypothetical protein
MIRPMVTTRSPGGDFRSFAVPEPAQRRDAGAEFVGAGFKPAQSAHPVFLSARQVVRRIMTRRIVLASLLLCLLPQVLLAGAVSGTIRNGTTNQPARGVDVLLFKLEGGMQVVEQTKTDAQGHYRIDDPGLGQAPMLLRAIYRGVNYHEPVPPGKTTVDVEVFEPTDKPNAFSVAAHIIVLQPSSADLTVGEIYSIQNKTQPPMAYFRQGGSFVFSIPDGAQLGDVSAQGSSGMPVTEGTIDKGKNMEAIAYPFRPGESGVRVSYKLPYKGDAKLRFVSPYAADRLAIFAPPGVQVSSEGFSQEPPDQGYNVYVRESVAANAPVSVAISGTGSVPNPNQGGASGTDDSQNPSVNSRLDQSGAEAPTAAATTLPARLDSLKWVLVAGFAALFALGFFYLWWRPQVLAPAGPASSVPDAPSRSKPAKAVAGLAPAVATSVVRATPSSTTAAPSSAAVVEEANRHVTGSLDELKDKLFRLELRRQAGTITDADYTRERARIEQLLRDLVRG